MIMITDTNNEIRDKFKELELDLEKIDDLVKNNYISKNLGEYAKRLAVLDFSILEAFYYAENGNCQRTVESLAEAKIYCLEAIAGILFEFKYLKGSVHTIPDYYRRLFDIAKQRYDEAVNKLESILSGEN